MLVQPCMQMSTCTVKLNSSLLGLVQAARAVLEGLLLIRGKLFVQGLDGEATEDVIRELQEPQAEAQDPEVQFAAAAALCAPLAPAAALPSDQRSNDEEGVHGGDVVAEAPSAVAGAEEEGSADTGLAVLVRVLSSPRATANPTHVYMLLRVLDAASKLKVCTLRSVAIVHRQLVSAASKQQRSAHRHVVWA